VTQVNLLPGDVRERERTRRLVVGVGVAVGAVLALLFFVFMLQVARLTDADQELQAQEEVNTGLRQQVGELQEFQLLKQQVAARQALVDEATAGEVLWSGVLGDLSKIIPGQMWLTGLTGTLAPPVPPAGAPAGTPGTAPATPGSVPATTLVGTIQFQGRALNHPTIAQWLSRLEQVTGWVNPWISNATKSQVAVGTTTIREIEFTGTVDVTTDAVVGGSAR
jgi:Tfp pilus assembly protein PilN